MVSRSFYADLSLLGDGFLQSLADLEGGNAGSGDGDLSLGLGVAADARAALLDLKSTEADQLNLLTGDESTVMASKAALTAFSLSFLDRPAFSATAATSSALFMYLSS